MSKNNKNTKCATNPPGKRGGVVKAPTSIGVMTKTSSPSVSGTNKVVVHRREFVGTATNGSVTGFAVTNLSQAVPGYDFNPSCPTMFPWLSQIANAFERFRFNSLKFEFIPGQSTATAGRFYAAVDYDYDDAVALTKPVLMGNMTAVESSIWQPCSLSCDASALNRDLSYRFVSCTSRGMSVEQRTSNSGFLMLAFDTTVADCLMDIWVTYTIELVTPVNEAAIIQNLPVTTSTATSVAAVTSAHGTGNLGLPAKSVTTNPPGAIVPVVASTLGVPALAGFVLGSAFSFPTALDIRSYTKSRGTLGLVTSFLETGAAPNAILGASGTDVNWQVMDYNGSYLGSVITPSTTKRTIGPASGAGGVVGAEIVSLMTVVLDSLFATFPTAKYIAPIIFSSAALGAGKSGYGFTYTD